MGLAFWGDAPGWYEDAPLARNWCGILNLHANLGI